MAEVKAEVKEEEEDEEAGAPPPPPPTSTAATVPPPPSTAVVPASTAVMPAAAPPGSAKTLLAANARSKKRGRPKLAAKGASADVVVPADSDLVRVLKVERSRADLGEALDGGGHVVLSRVAKAAQLTLSDDRRGVSGTKGYRTVRTTHGVHEGSWYCEVRVAALGPTGHVRLGWSTHKAELQAPAGYDKFGYSFRDLEGSKVHNGSRQPYAAAYREGDVVGLYLHLPPGGRSLEQSSRSMVRYKGGLYHLDERPPEAAELPGSAIGFSVNGVACGVAFRDVFEGTYYPTASLFTLPSQAQGASVVFNFGPDFAYPPPAFEGLPEPRAFDEAVAFAAEAAAAAAAEMPPPLGAVLAIKEDPDKVAPQQLLATAVAVA